MKTDRSTYLSSVGVLFKICLDNIACCCIEGIWSILILATAIPATLSITASSLFLVRVSF